MNKMHLKYTQNFITSTKNVKEILNYTNFGAEDTIIEIGAGKGHFTKEIARICKFVIAIEIDPNLSTVTKNSTYPFRNVKVLTLDCLKYPFVGITKPHKIYGNLPYNLSTDIIKKVTFESNASEMYFIVEEGFAKRILDTKRALGLLLLPKVNIQILSKIPREYFHPKPKVNSVLIKLKRKQTSLIKDEKLYRDFVYKWVNKEYKKLFTKNQFQKALKHAKITDLNNIDEKQFLSLFNSYILFRN